ncbi:hypothetical protein DMP08_04095 [Paraeggerthella hongkongensis]|uniref:Uncharacterized protein n=1 Tax=Paraeggerthella hongkongensis TaxID=230658 RepID=A0A3N0BG91_9ACTN|nr:hypothetical protein DMP08_04095 [Paraeggerthella hongkongensis]
MPDTRLRPVPSLPRADMRNDAGAEKSLSHRVAGARLLRRNAIECILQLFSRASLDAYRFVRYKLP